MYVCSMYVCMYVRMYVFMYVCMYVCIFIKLHVCMCVCMYVYLLNCTQPRSPALSCESFYATRIDPTKGGSMIRVTKTSDQTRERDVCTFIKLHITAQSGPVIRVILCHSH